MATTDAEALDVYSTRVENALESLEVAEQLWEAQEELGSCMRKGFLYLAKARLLLGRNTISPFNCREEFDANVRVHEKLDYTKSETVWEERGGNGMDPKLLFGALMPPELKCVQSEFQKALEAAIRSANIAARQLRLEGPLTEEPAAE